MLVELRTRTAIVCGALAIAIAASVILRGRPRKVHLLFAAFAALLGLWYLSQSFYGIFEATIWQRSSAVLALLLPVCAVALFEAMVPADRQSSSRGMRLALAAAAPLMVLQLTPLATRAPVRVLVFFYVIVTLTGGLWELFKRGARSTSRATQRRVRFLVLIGALAGVATLVDLAWIVGLRMPPVGAVLSILFVFALSQALVSERLLDLSEMLGRLVVAAAVAFLIALIFYILLTQVGNFNTMYLNAVLAATVLLVVYEPLQARVEEWIQRLFFRERFDLERALVDVRRRLVHTLVVSEMAEMVTRALERSRRITAAALYLRDQEGSGFDQIGAVGDGGPTRIEVATARMLLDRLEQGPILLEDLEREVRTRTRRGERYEEGAAILAAAEVLGASLKLGVVVGILDEEREIVGLLALADRRVRDALSVEDVALLSELGTQMGVVIQNSRTYQQMKDRDRLALLGQMAAGLAHEIRNPLGAIKGAAQLLAEPGPAGSTDPAAAEFIGIILEEVDRLNRVVGSVLDLARPDARAVVPIDANGVARRTVQILSAERQGTHKVDIQLNLAPDLPRVAIDPEELRQVLMNLLRNAVQAVGESGKVTITTRVRFGRGTRSGKSEGDAFVEITVADTGPGISRKALEKLFLPFFTTKEKGTGLGLAISHRIVQGAGGRIEVRSYEGKGSTFTVLLPAAIESLGTPTPRPTRSAEKVA
ncbi:MAG: ATP-binding protein [Polyangiaceae bacterium]